MRSTSYTSSGIVIPLVWYESPFGPSEWMDPSQAERLLERDFQLWKDTLQHDAAPPRIVGHDEHVAEVAERVRARIEHKPSSLTLRGVRYCLRCGKALYRNGKTTIPLRELCQPVKVGARS